MTIRAADLLAAIILCVALTAGIAVTAYTVWQAV